MKTILKIYNPRSLKKTLNLYGFKYSYKDYLKESFLILAGIVVISYVYHLSAQMFELVVISVILMIPLIIYGWHKTGYSYKRFAELSDYLTNIIPVFNNKPKIIYTLKELEELTSGEINKKIKEAADYIEKTVNDPGLFENGLKIISDSFHNSRVLSVHHFLVSVEKCDSRNYQLIADSLYLDIENWIKRVCLYQKELIDRRNKLIILSLSSLVINSFFVYIYQNEDFFKGFIENPIYQLSTALFVILIALVITVSLSSMSGEWLINDEEKVKESNLKKTYLFYRNHVTRTKVQIIVSLLFVICGAYFYYLGQIKLMFFAVLMALIINNLNRLKSVKAKKKLKEYFTVTFPLWLREVSLSIGNLTVLNSISNSVNSYEFPLRKELKKFISDAQSNPTSIKPYNDFLSEFEIDGCKSSMRILFSLNSLSEDNVKERLSFLSERNQELLGKSESIRNRNALMTLELLGFLPIVLFTAETLISIGIMFAYVINNMGANII